MPTAVVSGVYGALYSLLDENQNTILAAAGGRLRLSGATRVDGKKSNPVVAGDQVEYEPGKDGQTSLITAIFPRQNSFIRADQQRHHVMAANLDLVLVFQSVAAPDFNPGFLDRALIEIENSGIPAAIVINKADFLETLDSDTREELNRRMAVYRSLGYPVFCESFSSKVSLPLQSLVATGRTLLMGQSGVGKSTFLNRMAGKELNETQEVNLALRGRHTTTNPRLFQINQDMQLIDIPGVKEYGLGHLSQVQLNTGFREFADRNCKFDNCSHTHEPHCGVKLGVEENRISEARYKSYLAIVESMSDQWKPRKGDFWRGVSKKK